MLLFSCAGKQWLETVFYGLVLDSDFFCPRGVGSAAVARAPPIHTYTHIHTRGGTESLTDRGYDTTQLDRRDRKRNKRLKSEILHNLNLR